MGMQSYYELRQVDSLRVQAFNSQQYDNFESTINGEFLDSIRKNGVLVPLAITKSGLILSGHRRLAAAKKAGHDRVPCNVYSNTEDWEKQRLTYDLNLHHQRSNEENARRLQYKLEMEVNERKGRTGAPISAQAPKSEATGRTLSPIEAVAKSEGIGKHKAAQMLETIETIDDLTQKGDSETVAVIRDKLENESVNAAHKVVQATRPPNPAAPAKPVEPDTTPDEDEDRSWKKSDATKFRAAFQTIIRTIDRGAELDQLTVGKHAEFLRVFKKFGNDWQKLFSEQEWL